MGFFFKKKFSPQKKALFGFQFNLLLKKKWKKVGAPPNHSGLLIFNPPGKNLFLEGFWGVFFWPFKRKVEKEPFFRGGEGGGKQPVPILLVPPNPPVNFFSFYFFEWAGFFSKGGKKKLGWGGKCGGKKIFIFYLGFSLFG